MRYWLSLLIILAAVLVGCNGNDDDEDDTPPDAQTLITEAAQNLDQAQSFRLLLRQEGAPTEIEVGLPDELSLVIVFQNAEAFFVSPDRIQATVSVGISDATQEINIVVVEDRQYVNHGLLTGGEWQQLRFAQGFEASDLQSPDNGIGAALMSMTNLEYVGTAEVSGGIETYHLRGTVDANKIRSVTVGLMATEEGDIGMDVYVRRQGTRRVARLELDEPTADGEVKHWVIEFDRYDNVPEIQEPES